MISRESVAGLYLDLKCLQKIKTFNKHMNKKIKIKEIIKFFDNFWDLVIMKNKLTNKQMK